MLREVSAKIDGLTGKFEELKENYKNSINEIRGKINALLVTTGRQTAVQKSPRKISAMLPLAVEDDIQKMEDILNDEGNAGKLVSIFIDRDILKNGLLTKSTPPQSYSM